MPNEVTDFEQDVLESSREQPVLVDFWAPWCGPCRTLGPRLEALAEEQSGRWTLVKINTDEHPELARRYGIRGIPAVKLFVDGAVADEFTGALPEHAIRNWLDEALPSENKKRIAQAREALADGEQGAAELLLRAVLDREPDHGEARVLLARTILFSDTEEAETLASEADVAAPELLQTKEAVQTLAHLLRLKNAPDELPDEDGKQTYLQAIEALAQQDFDTALDRFIEVIQQNRYYDDDGARKACVALFTVLGNDHPTVRAHRRTFDMALY